MRLWRRHRHREQLVATALTLAGVKYQIWRCKRCGRERVVGVE